MRIVYFDCFAGVSGDMIVGALLDLGVDFDALKQQLSSLAISNYGINLRRVERCGIAATKFDVEVDLHDQPARKLADIRSIILASSLSEITKQRSLTVFERLADAEAKVHGTTRNEIHFHEVGAVDSIVDIVAAMIGFEMLGVGRFYCSPLRVGRGVIEAEHGRLPVPAPATAELLKGAPIYAGDLNGEFVTPTGAAIVAALCEAFGHLPAMKINAVGYGAGTRDPKELPNALRLMHGEMNAANDIDSTKAASMRDESVTVIETNIDDMNPQVYGFVMERAFAIGALDVFMIPAQMKKDRPGVLLTVLCKPETTGALIKMLLAETTTLGVRYYRAHRRVLQRAIETVDTEYGPVRIKVARDGERTLHFQPEYEDCARLALETQTPLIEVQAAASAAYRSQLEEGRKPNLQDG
ncbi:MAG TPA: nickel pincer cofactor biosynthesis protein LarC [Blastocatellia bacterium]|nr:nickel pincer cofactor biosynthesis protein LarC [Blastocatellia bacterium]